MKSLPYIPATLALLCFKKVSELLSWQRAALLGSLAGRAAFALPSRQKKVAVSNLKAALGTLHPGTDYSSVAKDCFENLGMSLFEALASGKLSPQEVRKFVRVSGEVHLRKALSAGKGVIGVSAHLGNFSLTGIRLALDGYPFSYIFRYPNLGLLAGAVRALGKRHGVNFIPALPRKDAARKAVKSLRRNNIVCILADQHDMHGIGLDFFGMPAVTAAGPVILAMRTGAKIIPMFSLRGEEGVHTVFIEPGFELELSGDYARDVRENTAGLNKIIERYVRSSPGQWWWMHRRWREAMPPPGGHEA